MSVKVTSFSGDLWDYTDDEFPPATDTTPAGHKGQLDASTIVYATNQDGTQNTNLIMVTCPEDGSASWWPSGGGADPRLGQMLHLKIALKSMPRADALILLKAKIAATDGPDRFCLTDEDINEVDNAASPNPTV